MTSLAGKTLESSDRPNPVDLLGYPDGGIGDPWAHSKLSGDVGIEAIVAAAGRVESLEWDLDRAHAVLTEVIEQAADTGHALAAIADAAGMTKADVSALLWAARSGRRCGAEDS